MQSLFTYLVLNYSLCIRVFFSQAKIFLICHERTFQKHMKSLSIVKFIWKLLSLIIMCIHEMLHVRPGVQQVGSSWVIFAWNYCRVFSSLEECRPALFLMGSFSET